MSNIKRLLKHTPLHPRYLSNQAIRRALRQLAPRAKGHLLDIGCGYKPYKKLFQRYVESHVGIDVPSTMHGREATEIAGSALKLPIADRSFDTVLATEVMEHVPEPEQMLSEIHRVLRPHGFLILSVPLHEPLHELPYDYYRYTPNALEHLLEKQGFCTHAVRPRGGVMLVVCHLLCSYLYRRFGSIGYPQRMQTKPLQGMLVIFLCMLLQIVSFILDKLFYDEFDTLGFVVLAEKSVDKSLSQYNSF